jgi:hypothetical protein
MDGPSNWVVAGVDKLAELAGEGAMAEEWTVEMPEREPTYPWLRLLESELQREPKPSSRKRAGRPRNTFPRRRVRAALTEDEQAALDTLVDALSEHMQRAIHRGHLIAFMTFRLRSQLQRGHEIVLPDDIDSFVALAKYLDASAR